MHEAVTHHLAQHDKSQFFRRPTTLYRITNSHLLRHEHHQAAFENSVIEWVTSGIVTLFYIETM